MEVAEEQLAEFFATIDPLLDERQRRMTAGAVAHMLGHGGTTTVARLAHMSRNTVLTGAREVQAGVAVRSDRVRREGAGRKRSIDKDPNLLLELDDLVSPEARGDPMSPLRWTAKSTYQLADTLRTKGFDVGPTTVRELLHEMGYSLQGTSKQKEGAQHVDRDAQFHHINDTAGAFCADNQPVISVDAKKKELIGEYSNAGKEYQPKGKPARTKVHDFIDPEMGKAIPYGVYDLGADEGWVSVGDDADTAGFAVATIGRWWAQMGRALPQGHPTPHLCRRRRIQRLPDQGLEGRAGQAGQRNRTRDHRGALPARNLQVEQDRTPTVQLHHHELERTATHFLPGHGATHRQHHNHQGAQGQRRARRGALPDRGQDHGQGVSRGAAHPQ
jgi:hypothetical protein